MEGKPKFSGYEDGKGEKKTKCICNNLKTYTCGFEGSPESDGEPARSRNN